MIPLLACAAAPTPAPDAAAADSADPADTADTACAEVEVCDGADNDCDGSIDEDLLVEWYLDEDGDGWGTGAVQTGCAAPEHSAPTAGDCDDARIDVHPDAEEICENAADDDCDGGDHPCFGGDIDLGTALVPGIGETGAGLVVIEGVIVVGSPQVARVDLVGVASFTGDDATDETGSALAAPGDVNADGNADLVIASPKADGASQDTGYAWVEFGPFSGDRVIGGGGDRLITWSAGENELGRAVSGGDFDGDGRADVLVGAPEYDKAAGGGFLVPGPISNGIGGLTVNLTGGTVSDRLGWSVLGPIDVDGDGFGDVIAGVPGWDLAGASAGGAVIVHGPDPFDGTVDDAHVSVPGAGQHGKALAVADADGDGHLDLFLAGEETVLLLTLDGTVALRSTLDVRASSLVIVGDADGDDVDDLALANDAETWIVRGPLPAGSFAPEANVDARVPQGGTLAAPGDLDLDGYDDLLLGDPAADGGLGGVFAVYGSGL